MDLATLTLEQLKALAFDEFVKRDIAVNNLNILQVEMQKRIQVPIPQEIDSPSEPH